MYPSGMKGKYRKRYASKQAVSKLTIVLLLNGFFLFKTLPAQINIDSAYSFIEQHEALALRHLFQDGIPASVTLAQAIYESGSGSSYLSQTGNNFFGIKCHREWGGDSLIKDDEEKNECFRRYRNIEECYEDRAMFLKSRSRYHFLFDLPLNDYKSWCSGLQSAGYATDKNYAATLIYIIEKYRLYKHEEPEYLTSMTCFTTLIPNKEETQMVLLPINEYVKTTTLNAVPANQIVKAIVQKHYHIASKGQTPDDVSLLYGIDVRLLCSNNRISPQEVFTGGEVLFLTKKKSYKYQLPVNQ